MCVESALQRALAISPGYPRVGLLLTQIDLERGDIDAAFAWLERALALRDPGLTDLKVDRLLRPLHDDPRYAALLARMGLAETIRTSDT